MKACLFILLCCTMTMLSCKRSDFLNARPDDSQVVPGSLSDLQAVLDFDVYMNGIGTAGRGPVPSLGELGADDYYVLDADFDGRLSQQSQNYYTWASNPYTGEPEYNWNYPYWVVFSSNAVLDALGNISRGMNPSKFDEIRGEALFHRAHVFYQMAQVFAKPYQEAAAAKEAGILLRLTADVNEIPRLVSVEQTYNEIISELTEAAGLLPATQSIKTRPSKQAAYGLLARTYQTMQRYNDALLYADSCLTINDDLLDYNTLNSSLSYPFVGGAQVNPEVIFSCNMVYTSNNPASPLFAKADSTLYKQYADHDLRKLMFFRESNGQRFKGSYAANTTPFSGIATDEILLIQAECLARAGQVQLAMNALNALIKKRWDRTIAFVPYAAGTVDEAVNVVLQERRKELLFRGLRWTDLRRLNLEGRNITLTRSVNGQQYTLLPNDLRYIYPIPPEVAGFYPDLKSTIR